MISTNIKFIPPRPAEAKETLANNQKALNLLKWQPKINIEDYIKNRLSEIELMNLLEKAEHPLTCGNDRTDENHTKYQKENPTTSPKNNHIKALIARVCSLINAPSSFISISFPSSSLII